jgi:hypothetical protein
MPNYRFPLDRDRTFHRIRDLIGEEAPNGSAALVKVIAGPGPGLEVTRPTDGALRSVGKAGGVSTIDRVFEALDALIEADAYGELSEAMREASEEITALVADHEWQKTAKALVDDLGVADRLSEGDLADLAEGLRSEADKAAAVLKTVSVHADHLTMAEWVSACRAEFIASARAEQDRD